MPPSHSPEVSTDATLTLTRGLNRNHPHTHQRSQQMLHSHSPEASTDATLMLTRGLNRCYTHTHQRPQQMLHSHSPEASIDATLTLTRGLNRCYPHTHKKPSSLEASSNRDHHQWKLPLREQRPSSSETMHLAVSTTFSTFTETLFSILITYFFSAHLQWLGSTALMLFTQNVCVYILYLYYIYNANSLHEYVK